MRVLSAGTGRHEGRKSRAHRAAPPRGDGVDSVRERATVGSRWLSQSGVKPGLAFQSARAFCVFPCRKCLDRQRKGGYMAAPPALGAPYGRATPPARMPIRLRKRRVRRCNDEKKDAAILTSHGFCPTVARNRHSSSFVLSMGYADQRSLDSAQRLTRIALHRNSCGGPLSVRRRTESIE